MQAPRQTGRMWVGHGMQRKRWGGEVERTGNGAVHITPQSEQGKLQKLKGPRRRRYLGLKKGRFTNGCLLLEDLAQSCVRGEGGGVKDMC